MFVSTIMFVCLRLLKSQDNITRLYFRWHSHKYGIPGSFVRTKAIIRWNTHEYSITQCFVRVKVILLGCSLGGAPMSKV